MTEYRKPVPAPTVETKPFWDYCKRHELRMQKCGQCGHIRYPPSMFCPKCQSMQAEWSRLTGKGKVYSFIIVRFLYDRAFRNDIPYVVATIELEEGPRIMSNVTGCNVEDVKVDMPVEVYYEDITDEFALPKFKPIV